MNASGDERFDFAAISGQGRAVHQVEAAVRRFIDTGETQWIKLLGLPGSPKTMIARRALGLLPATSDSERMEISAAHRAAGLVMAEVEEDFRPFRAPHHTCSAMAIAGRYGLDNRPTEAALAHRGILYLDEAPEFTLATLETLAQTLRAGSQPTADGRGWPVSPALVILALMPCSCGRGDALGPACTCSDPARYRSRLDALKLPRFFFAEVTRAPADLAGFPAESTELIRSRLGMSREVSR